MAGLYGADSGGTPHHKLLYRNSYGSIGGVDIKVVIAGQTVGNIQAISYSITREKAPVYTMGSVEPRGFARGKRGIAGSLVFVMFDMHALLALFRGVGADSEVASYKFVSDKDELRPEMVLERTLDDKAGTTEFGGINRAAIQLAATGAFADGRQANYEGSFTPGNALSEGWEVANPWYADQIASFNIVLVGVNEDGVASQMGILGAEILNEGYGVSINDLVSEQQMTYVARAVSAWSGIAHNFFDKQTIQTPYNSIHVPVSRAAQEAE